MSPALPREERDAIRARADRATEGPWGHHAHTHGLPSDGPTHVCVFDPEDVPVAELDYSSWGERDAEFIAHARTDVPALLDALDAAEVENERLRGLVPALREGYDACESMRVSNYPERAQAAMLGQDTGPLRGKVTDAVLAAVAAHDGLAPLLRAHTYHEWAQDCRCRIAGDDAMDGDDWAAHLADVVRAWLRGTT